MAEKSKIKSEIMAAIAGPQEPNIRTVLSFMVAGFDEIGEKIDALHTNQQHNEHHDFVQRRIEVACCDELCQWWKEKKEMEKENAASRRKIRDGWLERFVWFITGMIGLALLSGLMRWAGH